MTRAFGNIEKLPSGRYRVRYPDEHGRPTRVKGTFRTKAEAERRLVEIDHAIRNGTYRDPSRGRSLFGDYAADWLEVHKPTLAVSTWELYGSALRLHIEPQLGALRLSDLTADDVRRWYSNRLGATGRTATAQAYRLLRNILNTAVADDLIVKNPCQVKNGGDPKTPERPYMSQEEAGQLIDALPHYLLAPATVTVLCHLRLGELLGLQRGEVDLAAGVLHVRRAVVRTNDGPLTKSTKTGQARSVVMPPEAITAVRSQLITAPPGLPTAPLFTHPTGRALAREHIGRAWRQARVSAGLPEFH